MRVLLLQLDGSIPNLALMRLARHHRDAGHHVELRHARSGKSPHAGMFEQDWDCVYASLIFEKTRPLAETLQQQYPGIVLGGSGWDEKVTVEQLGVKADTPPDYTDYPGFKASLGFTQRGCRLKCSFCKVPRMEGKVRAASTIKQLWRGEPWPRNLLLLDNDFFGQENWRDIIQEINDGGFKVCFNQGFNVRLIGEEEATAIASVQYRDDQFKTRRLYTAWDNRRDEDLLFRNLEALRRHGVKSDDIMVYILIGYNHATKEPQPRLTEDDFHRHRRLREFSCRPYPMPFVRNAETRGFQRWIVGAYDKRVSWADWEAAGYEPRNLGAPSPALFELEGA